MQHKTLTSDQQLQISLRPGDIIIATDTHYFDYDEEVKKKHLYSQQPGDLLMVNNINVNRRIDGEIYHIADFVSGTSLNGVAYNGRQCIGLGGSLTVGKFRLATPDDPGYIATREVFELHDNKTIKKLKEKLLFVYVMAIVCLLMGSWVLSTGFM